MDDSDLKNYYSEISKQCHEEKSPVIITVNGYGDTVILCMQDIFDDIRKSLSERKLYEV